MNDQRRSFFVSKNKNFSTKLVASHVLFIILIALIIFQFIFSGKDSSRLLILGTLITATITSLFLISETRKSEVLKNNLQEIKNEQKFLIHFLSHQIKGFFTKSRNIFSVILEEKNSISKSLIPLVDEGLRSDKEGIELVTNILTAENLKTGKTEYKKSDFNLIDLMKSILIENKSRAEKKGLKINLHTDNFNNEELIIKGDPHKIKEVFTNLIQNSIHYTFNGGINVYFKKEDNYVLTTIKDTGVGLTDSDKLKIFKSASRGDDSIKYNVNSTGYGLYIARKITEHHGGTITANSAGRDKGSSFIVKLPLK